MLILSIRIATKQVAIESAASASTSTLAATTALATLIMMLSWCAVWMTQSVIQIHGGMHNIRAKTCRYLRGRAYAWGLWKRETITIPESPMPTKSCVTPASRNPLRARVMRGGHRLPSHRRSSTLWYSPPSRNDCGFMTVLLAAGYRPTPTKISWIRTQVAAAMYHDYILRTVRQGLHAEDAVTSTQETLQYADPPRTLHVIEVYDRSLWTAYCSPPYPDEGEGEEEEEQPSYEHEETYDNDHQGYDEDYDWGDQEDQEDPDHLTYDGYLDDNYVQHDEEHQTIPDISNVARRVTRVMRRIRHSADMPRGGTLVDAGTQTDITVAPPNRTPAMLDPSLLYREYEEEEQIARSIQMVILEVPPTPRRQILRRYPLSLHYHGVPTDGGPGDAPSPV